MLVSCVTRSWRRDSAWTEHSNEFTAGTEAARHEVSELKERNDIVHTRAPLRGAILDGIEQERAAEIAAIAPPWFRKAVPRLCGRSGGRPSAIRAYAEGVLSVQAVAALRGITRHEAEAELREAGVVPGLAAAAAGTANSIDSPRPIRESPKRSDGDVENPRPAPSPG